MNAGLKRKGIDAAYTVESSSVDVRSKGRAESSKMGEAMKAEGTLKGQKGSPPPVQQKTKKEKPPFNERKRDARIFYAGIRGKRKYNQKQVIDALVAADGSLTHAAKILGTTFRHLKKFVEANDKITEVVQGIEEETLDLAEGSLRKHIEGGNLTAVIFFLKTRGKKRGYIEDEKVDMSKVMQPVAIIYHSPRDPEYIRQQAQQKQIENNATIDITPLMNAAPA